MAQFLAELEAIDPDGLDETDQASYAVLDYILTHAVALPNSQSAMLPFTNDSGFHNAASFTALNERVRSVEHAEAWISRIQALPDQLAVYTDWLASKPGGPSLAISCLGSLTRLTPRLWMIPLIAP